MPKRPPKVPFKQVIQALLDTTRPFPPSYLHRFSDLERYELRELREAWPKIELTRRLALLEDLEETADADTLVDFDAVALQAMSDTDGAVRARAYGMLWEYNGLDLLNELLEAVTNDEYMEARAAAASALGKFIYLGELEEISAEILKDIEDKVLAVASGKDEALVRRRAVEALGFSSRPEVPALIRQAYDSRDQNWIVSALYAMGRSYDSIWEPDVKRELRSPIGEIQLEAVRAAGALGLQSTRRILLDLLEDEATDSEIRAETIWSLSEIGGEEVRKALEDLLDETDDEEEAELLEEAIDNLTLNEQIESMNFLDIDLEEEARSGHVVDLSSEENDDEEDDDGNPETEPGAGMETHEDEPGKAMGETEKKNRPRHRKK